MRSKTVICCHELYFLWSLKSTDDQTLDCCHHFSPIITVQSDYFEILQQKVEVKLKLRISEKLLGQNMTPCVIKVINI